MISIVLIRYDASRTRQSSRTYLVVLDREENESVGVLLEDRLIHLVALESRSRAGLWCLGLGEVIGHRNALDGDSDLV